MQRRWIWESGCLKPVNSLQASPDADVNDEGWSLRLAFQTASEGIFFLFLRKETFWLISLYDTCQRASITEYLSALYSLFADGNLAP